MILNNWKAKLMLALLATYTAIAIYAIVTTS